MENNKNATETTEVTKPTTEHLAMEVLKNEHDKHTAKNRGLFVGMIILAILTATVTIVGAFERAHLIEKNYQNDCDWRKLFSEYDFVSQDGNGINSANYGEQGDLNNGAENKDEEEQGDR